jgi:hypothetical protein
VGAIPNIVLGTIVPDTVPSGIRERITDAFLDAVVKTDEMREMERNSAVAVNYVVRVEPVLAAGW